MQQACIMLQEGMSLQIFLTLTGSQHYARRNDDLGEMDPFLQNRVGVGWEKEKERETFRHHCFLPERVLAEKWFGKAC